MSINRFIPVLIPPAESAIDEVYDESDNDDRISCQTSRLENSNA